MAFRWGFLLWPAEAFWGFLWLPGASWSLLEPPGASWGGSAPTSLAAKSGKPLETSPQSEREQAHKIPLAVPYRVANRYACYTVVLTGL